MRLPGYLKLIEDGDKKRSRSFESRACSTRLKLASREARPVDEQEYLEVELLVGAWDQDEVRIYHPIGFVGFYEDGTWSYFHTEEGLRRGLFTGLHEAVRRLVHSVTSGYEAEPATQRQREEDPHGHVRYCQSHPSFGMIGFSRVSCGGTGEAMDGVRLTFWGHEVLEVMG